MSEKKIDFKNIDVPAIKKFVSDNAIVLLLLLLIVYVGISRENFISIQNLQNVARNASVRLLMAFGVSGCLITRGTDLSASRIPAVSGCLAASLLQKREYAERFFQTLPKMGGFGEEYPLLFVLIVIILAAAFFGLLNGIVVAYLQVPPFIATLGMQQVIYGILMLFTKNRNIGLLRPDYAGLASGTFLGMPYLFIIAFVAGLLMWFLYNYTRFGKYMYAIGGNEVAAEVSGISVQFTLVKIYTLAACLYGLAGFLSASKSGSASVAMTQGWELEAIAACTIGGVSTGGGMGKISGIVIGVMVFELMKNSINFLGIDMNFQPVLIGMVIIIAVAVDIRNYLAKK